MFLILLNILHLNSLRLLKTRFYISMFHIPQTHSQPNQRSILIGLIFTSDEQSFTNLIYALTLRKSHHKILKLIYLIKCSLNQDKIHYLYHAANFNSMKNDLHFIAWPILDSCDTISCWESFLNTTNSIISKYTPRKKPYASQKRLIWMNKDALAKLK